MKIKKIVKKDKFVILVFESEVLNTYDEVVIKYSLYRPQEISDEVYLEIKRASLYYNYYYKALELLKYAHSEFEITQKLLGKGCNREIINEVVLDLKKTYLIDDRVYANMIFLKYSDKKGPLEIKLMLYNKGIANEIIAFVLQKYDYTLQIKNLRVLLSKSMSFLKKYPISISKQMFLNKAINKGYNPVFANHIVEITNEFDIIDENALLIAYYDKAFNRYSKRFKETKLEEKIFSYLIAKGFRYNKIMEIKKMHK